MFFFDFSVRLFSTDSCELICSRAKIRMDEARSKTRLVHFNWNQPPSFHEEPIPGEPMSWISEAAMAASAKSKRLHKVDAVQL